MQLTSAAGALWFREHPIVLPTAEKPARNDEALADALIARWEAARAEVEAENERRRSIAERRHLHVVSN